MLPPVKFVPDYHYTLSDLWPFTLKPNNGSVSQVSDWLPATLALQKVVLSEH